MSESMTCRHLTRSEEVYVVTDAGPVRSSHVVLLCAWADNEPAKLVDTPRWVQRNALAGHLYREGDCAGCPCFDAALSSPTNTD